MANRQNVDSIREMRVPQFLTIIRQVRREAADRVEFISRIVAAKLEELGIESDLTLAEENTPPGSDQFDAGTFKTWVEGIRPETAADPAVYDEAIKQLKIIDATAHARLD